MLWIKSCKRDINFISGPTERKGLSKFQNIFLCNKTSRVIDWSSWDLQGCFFICFFIFFFSSFLFNFILVINAQEQGLSQQGCSRFFLVAFGIVVAGRNLGILCG